jgi:hypothetical protein
MRRRTLILAAGAVVLMTLLCGSVAVREWLAQGDKLVIRGARDVTIARRGLSQLHLTYRLPNGRTINDLRIFLIEQGWRRVTFSNSDRTTLSFARRGWPAMIREILVITLDPQHREIVDLQFARCFVSTWVKCF